jgi:hypothetical protein
MKALWHSRFGLTLCLLPLLATACAPAAEPGPPDCSSGSIQIAPTATRPTDPDLFSPPGPPPDGGDGAVYCPTPAPAQTSPEEFPEQFVTAEVVNLSLDIVNQDLAAAAVGDDMLAVAWLNDGDIYLALSRGGNHFQARRVDQGESVSLAFSKINRLHLAYEQDGRILYRAADQGTHPADVEAEYVANGRRPQVVLNQYNYAQVLFEDEDAIYQAAHVLTGSWQVGYITEGSQVRLTGYGSDLDLGYIVAYRGAANLIHLANWQTTPYGFFPYWAPVAGFTIPPNETLTGPIGLDFLAVNEEEAWVYAAWVTRRPFPEPPPPLYAQPIFAAVNPLYPHQIANPHLVYHGLNAARWYTFDRPFDAGLKQTISVPDPAGIITLSAWGVTETAVPGSVSLQIGLDPTGGDNAYGANVVWSAPAAPGTFTQFSLSAAAQGPAATVFLRGTLQTPALPGTAAWDEVTVHNGVLANGSFEGPFVEQDSVIIPESWTAWYQESGPGSSGGRDVYTVYAAWSDNGGSTWTGPEAVAANRGPSGGTTGAIRPDVYPIISTATEPPSVTFFYIYETGDPPPGSIFLRFGRPYQTRCTLGTVDCSDSPGAPLLPHNVARPSYRLQVARDPFRPDRAVMAWDALQADVTDKDLYATYLVLR